MNGSSLDQHRLIEEEGLINTGPRVATVIKAWQECGRTDLEISLTGMQIWTYAACVASSA